MTLNIENTELAFRAASDAELKRSHWLYSILNYPTIAKLGEKSVKAALALHLPIQPIIRATIFRQFCGGETMESCQNVIDALAAYHIGTVLDYSVEAGHTDQSFDATASEILRTVDFAHEEPDVAFCVFKMSGVSPFSLLEKKSSREKLSSDEAEEWKKVVGRVHSICERAHKYGVRLFIDAEESWIQPAIDELTEAMMQEFNQKKAIVFNTLQMYRQDRPEFLRASLERAKKGNYFLGIKLVRGAYMEKERARAHEQNKPSPIWEDKAATDRAYDEALRYCVSHIDRIAFVAGTHNEKSTLLLARLMDENQIERRDPRIYFSQLLGMGNHLTYNLAAAGFNTAKYVPYGPVRAVMPYLFRRAEENTAIRGQTGRELELISRELERRRAQPHSVKAAQKQGS